MRVALVLRSGGEYRPEHVQALTKQLRAQFYDPLVFTDMVVPGVETTKLHYPWAGWWSKMNLFDPRVKGDLLAMDLDTRLFGSIDEIASRTKMTLLRDFYKPHKLQSGLMYLPEAARAETWERWHEQMIHVFQGDGQFLDSVWRERADTWQDELPGQVVSYKCHVMHDPRKQKVHVGDGTVPTNARVVCWHGKPRPWDVAPLKKKN